MSLIKKILWACDFSQASKNGLIYANQLAKIFNAEIVGLNVIQVPLWACYDMDESYCEELLSNIEEMKQKSIIASEKIFEKVARKEKEQGILFRYQIKTGRANEEIANFAMEEKAQLIVMGNKSGEGEGVGSTVFKVLKSTQVPTMVVKKVIRKAQINKILLPVDLQMKWVKAFDVAVGISDRSNADIYLLHIIEIYNYEGIGEVRDKLLSYATKMVEDSARQLKSKAGRIRVYEYARKAINAPIGIVDFINKNKIDLVIMGTHARTGLSKFILGSVTERIIEEARVPIIAVPPVD